MNRIVKEGLITDLHIHSVYSKHKDVGKDYMNQNTIENISVLINKLNENNVSICSISDHDYFSYEMYNSLRSEEGKGSIQKVLPAVEFSVMMKRDSEEKQIHVVTIFDDKDQDKIKNIETVLAFENGKPKYDKVNSFSENRFIEILNEIDLNTLCIAHQKKSPMSEQKPAPNDALSLGEEAFNEFIFAEYFEAFEFRNKRNEIFNNITKTNMKGDLLRFITGSDCHDWTVYPKYNKKEKDDNFKFTYLKCLPTFRGVALAITEDSRISLNNNFFNQSRKILEAINLTIDGEEVIIPLSHGINAIIGDNSIGKSLLIHKLTDYYRKTEKKSLSSINDSIQKKYEDYLGDNKIEVNSKIERNEIFEFDTQGEIRKKFNQKLLKEEEFFKDKYPSDVNTVIIKNVLKTKIEEFIKMLKNRFEYTEQLANIDNISIIDSDESASSLLFTQMDTSNLKNEKDRFDEITKQITKLKVEYNKLLKMLKDENELKNLNKALDYLILLEAKYEIIKTNLKNQMIIANLLNVILDDRETEMLKIRTSNDQLIDNYIVSKNTLISNLTKTLKFQKQLSDFDYSFEELTIVPNEHKYLNYTFINKTNIMEYNADYLRGLFKSPLDGRKNVNFETLNKESLIDSLKGYDAVDPLEFYKDKLITQLDLDLSSDKTIIEKKDNVTKEYSDGLNVKIYFNILSTLKNKNGMYIIDQPEDDVSPNSIKEHLLSDFKRMSSQRQILLVTHNPQFVVNLDVDNVVHLSKNENNKIVVKSGPLEYESEEYKILEIIADSLEGGVETIRKRWKKYEKNIYDKS